MFRNEFPTPAAYLSYIGECEDSLGHKYKGATETPPCYEDYNGCKNLRPCPEHDEADSNGLVFLYYPGSGDSTHCGSPMFTLKQEDGHETHPDGEEYICNNCDLWGWFHSMYTKHGDSLPAYANTPERAHDWWWKTLHSCRRGEERDVFGRLNEQTGFKKETRPDYTLSGRVRNP